MKRITLFSLSLLLISTCKAMEKSKGEKSNATTPTQFILGLISQSDQKNWSKYQGFNPRDNNAGFYTYCSNEYPTEYNPHFKDLVINQHDTKDCEGVYSIEAQDPSMGVTTRSNLWLSSRSNGATRELRKLETLFCVEGESAIKQFHERLNFYSIVNEKEHYIERLARDDKTICELVQSKDGDDRARYVCATNITYDDFIKELNDLKQK